MSHSPGPASSPAPQPPQTLDPPLLPGEQVLARFEPDLDSQLHFRKGTILLTSERVLACTYPGAPWLAWPRARVHSLTAREHAGLGSLELLGTQARLALWRYTPACSLAAHRFVDQFDQIKATAAPEPIATNHIPETTVPMPASTDTCPQCGMALDPDQNHCPACSPDAVAPRVRASLARLVRFAWPHRRLTLIGFALTLAATVISLIPTYLTAPLTNRVLVPLWQATTPQQRQDAYQLAGFYLLILAVTALAAWLLSWARAFVLAAVSERVALDLRNITYAHLQHLSLEFFGGKRTGDLMSRISSDTDRICYFISVHLMDFATDLFMIIATSVVLLTMDPILALASLLPFPVIYWLVDRSRVRMRHGFDRANRAWAAMTSVLADTIPGIRVVKAFAQEQREIERFSASNKDVLDANDRVNAIWSFFGPTVSLLTTGGLLIVWVVGIARIAQGAIRPGDLIAFQLFISRFYVRMEALSRMVQSTQRAAASAQRIFEILDRRPSVPEPAHPVPIQRLRGEIELRDVSFRYGSRTVLHNLDLHIRPGEMIGLVGHSGAGKSTLVNLVCRFYDVRSGTILADGIDIRHFALQDYRRNIGIVLQDPFLFYGTIAQNIAYGRPDASRQEIVAAARAARAHEFILRLPDGYDSMVGERGQALSGGERQRISIARALLIDPAILILDEATSSVDTETERQIQQALENLIRGRTTIAIAHRLSTLRRADRLVVLERGRIVEVGSHAELLHRDGPYARLHQAQQDLNAVEA